jgi:ABC-type Fe3+ transport system permease subunit
MKRLHRLAWSLVLAVAAVVLGLVPAANATRVPPEPGGGADVPAPVIEYTTTGITAWETVAIAVAAALVSAVAALLARRMLVRHRRAAWSA